MKKYYIYSLSTSYSTDDCWQLFNGLYLDTQPTYSASWKQWKQCEDHFVLYRNICQSGKFVPTTVRCHSHTKRTWRTLQLSPKFLLLSNAAVFEKSESWAHFSAILFLTSGFQKVESLNSFDLCQVWITVYLCFGVIGMFLVLLWVSKLFEKCHYQ